MSINYKPDSWILDREREIRQEVERTERTCTSTQGMTISFRMPYNMIAEIDYWVQKGKFMSRSEGVRYCVTTVLQKLK